MLYKRSYYHKDLALSQVTQYIEMWQHLEQWMCSYLHPVDLRDGQFLLIWSWISFCLHPALPQSQHDLHELERDSEYQHVLHSPIVFGNVLPTQWRNCFKVLSAHSNSDEKSIMGCNTMLWWKKFLMKAFITSIFNEDMDFPENWGINIMWNGNFLKLVSYCSFNILQ